MKVYDNEGSLNEDSSSIEIECLQLINIQEEFLLDLLK